MLAVTAAGASAVFISHLWQAGQVAEVHRVVMRNLRLGLGLMAAGGACILVLGRRLFDVWLGGDNYIGLPILILFFVLLFLETQCFIVTLGSRATEDEAFAFWALGAGVLKLGLAAILGARYGLIGIASSTLFAQLATNHWYMVYRGLKRLGISLESHLVEVLLPVTGLFIVVAVAVRLLLTENVFPTELSAVLGGAGVAGFLLTAFFWFFVLESGHRERLFARWQMARS
jgi:O-antigen/teichoic acid export membrane protein